MAIEFDGWHTIEGAAIMAGGLGGEIEAPNVSGAEPSTYRMITLYHKSGSSRSGSIRRDRLRP